MTTVDKKLKNKAAQRTRTQNYMRDRTRSKDTWKTIGNILLGTAVLILIASAAAIATGNGQGLYKLLDQIARLF